MVVTKAFGMGINSGSVRNVIGNGVPHNTNTCSWVQELGRAGQSGQAATILFRESDVHKVLGWLSDHDHLQNRLLRDTILAEYDIS